MNTLTLHHHGAVDGVTGSCHELRLGEDFGILVDCGLFQGAETTGAGRGGDLRIDFPIAHIKALVVTHVHIDHVGRIPYLLAAGFKGPILCSQPSAHLLPLVLEDAVQLGFTRDPDLVMRFLALLKQRIIALPYRHWFTLLDTPERKVQLRLQPAGHILGSAYVECDVQLPVQAQQTAQAQQSLNDPMQTQDSPVQVQQAFRKQQVAPVQMTAQQPAMRVQARTPPAMQTRRIVFSGDLGATYSPLLPAPKAPYRCDTLVIESTYGDRNHPDRRTRRALLKAVVEKALADQGVVLIPAFSIGRTQEILYELEAIIAQEKRRAAARAAVDAKAQANGKDAGKPAHKGSKRRGLDWTELGIIVDSPLASRFTESYRYLKPFWDKEALRVLRSGRDPLDFEQLITVGSHHEHEAMVRHLKQTNRGCVVIAASGMCAGGRIVNYLKALIEEPRTDIVLVGYQARGTPGRDIVDYAGEARRANGREPYVMLDGERYVIRAGVHQLTGYSAHADQGNLLNFVKRMRQPPSEIRLVHGDDGAKQTLQRRFTQLLPQTRVWIPGAG